MTESGGLQHSVATMGFIELGFALAALACYALAFNGALAPLTRMISAGCALLAAGAFAAFTEPWTHGVILMVLGIGGMGVFMALVWAVSALCGIHFRSARLPSALPIDEAPPALDAVGVVVPAAPLHSS